MIALLLVAAGPLAAQIPFPNPARPQSDSAMAADTIPVPVFRVAPPVRPMAAMARSLLLPGWGQSVLDRRVTGAIFVFWEGVTLTMTLKSAHQLAYYRAIGSEKVPAKKQELQDWAILLAFNHLLAGAEAYVSALLWDFPAEVEFRPSPGGATASIRLPLPALR
jgi:hypothetical protein